MKYYRGVYIPNDERYFKLSRSKVESFINCKRCFFLDRKLGISQPPSFPFNLNSAVDNLLKNEFDYFRKIGEPHPYIKKVGKNIIPFQHESLDKWNSLSIPKGESQSFNLNKFSKEKDRRHFLE